MTDVPISLTESEFPALDGPTNNSNYNNHNINNITSNSTNIINNNNTIDSPDSTTGPIAASKFANSWSNHHHHHNSQHQQQFQRQQHHHHPNQIPQHPVPASTPNTIDSTSSHLANIGLDQQQQQHQHQQEQQNNLNYLILSNSQQHNFGQIYQQQANPITSPTANSINNILGNNNNMMQQAKQPHQQLQSQPQQIQQQHQPQHTQHKKPGLPNSIISSERCCTFKIAPEERRHRDFELEQSKILKEIMQKTNTKIEVTTTKDGALNFCIIGKEAYLKAAKNLVLNDFQTTVTLTVTVPKPIHGRLLGPKGARLAAIQEETQTKIAIPRKEEDSDIIKIVGLKSSAEAAIRSIQKYVREFAGKTVEKVTVERIYLLFITGPFNENLKRWEEMGVKVSTSGGILPSQNERESGNVDEVTFTIIGEVTVVQQVRDEIVQIYEDKKKKCTTVNMEVKKTQHKYILGPGGQNLRNLFAKTGVSIEVPQESESETITLRGERSKLAPALSELYTQAHSETDEFIEVESWLHKYLIGARKSNFIDFKARGIDAKSLDDKIKLHGPPTEVEEVKELLEAEVENVRKTIIRKDIRIELRIHGYIIGKAGATVDQIREESGAHVIVPKNDDNITLEGTAEAVALAEEKINAIAKKYESSKKLVIDQQLHGSIIGRGGEKIRSIREKFSQVVFTFPEQGSRNNEIIILGPADEVTECYNYLDEFHKQLQESNHQVQVPIKKDVIKYIPDAQGAFRRIKTENKVKIDLFIANNDIATTPAKEADGKSSANATNNKQGSSGKKQQQSKVSESSESATISNGVKVEEADPKNKKAKGGRGKKQQDQSAQQAVSLKSGDGLSVTKSNDITNGAKSSENYALVIGKKEDVDLAVVKVAKLLDELATTIEVEVKVPYKLRSMLGPKTRTYLKFLDSHQNKIVVSFPKQTDKQPSNKQQPQQANVGGDSSKEESQATAATVANGSGGEKAGNSASKVKDNNKDTSNKDRIDLVKIRGPKNIVKKAEKSFETLIADSQEKLDKNYTSSVLVNTSVFEKFVYSDKIKLNKIREAHNVKLTIPDGRDTFQLKCTFVGYEKNVQEALKEFNELCKDVDERTEETIDIPNQMHPRLIGVQGRVVKKMMDEFKINVKFARQGDPNPNAVVLIGSASSILAAKNHMLKLVNQYTPSINNMNNN